MMMQPESAPHEGTPQWLKARIPKLFLHKGWHFLRTYVLTLARFNLFLQGTLLIVIILETNSLLLLRRHYSASLTPTIVEDWVMMGSGGAEFLLAPLLAWWGRDKRNFALSTILALAAASGLLVLSVPFADISHPYVELCGGEVIARSDLPEAASTMRPVLLITCALLSALARVSVYAHGLTYLDDHQPDNGAFFYGILISIQLSLGINAEGFLQTSSLSPNWWKAQLSISSLTLMFAILFTLFPSQMKDFCEEDERPVYTGFSKSLNRIVRNKPLVLQSISLAMLNAAVFGFVHYDRAYVQARFHIEAYRQDPQTSRRVAKIFQSLVIIFFIMIFRVRFSSRRSDGIKANTASKVGGVLAIVLAVFLVSLAALSCDLGIIEGMAGGYEQPACSQSCGCDSKVYGFSPVCGVDSQTTYFSPCNAGCGEFEDLNGFLIFGNCTCGMNRAVRGACSVAGCRTSFGAYQILYTVMLAVAGAAFLMQGMVILRAAKRLDKPIAMGASLAASALLAFVLGHLLYMLISYFTCAYPDGYHCMLHNETLWIVVGSSALLATGSAAVSLYASTTRPPVEPTTEL